MIATHGRPAPIVDPVAVNPPSPSPLAGDLVAALASRIGADRAAAWVARQLGANGGCGCKSRQETLNRLDRAVRAFLARH